MAAKAFSKRSFRKEANALARKAGSKKALGLFEAALKRKQAKQSKCAKKRKAVSEEESDSAESDVSLQVIERPIAVRKKRKVSMILPDKTKEKAAKLKKYLAKVATLEEEKAFLEKITTKDPDYKAGESSGSDDTEEGQESD